MKKLLKYLFLIFASLATLVIITLNVRLHQAYAHYNKEAQTEEERMEDALKQQFFLKQDLLNNGADKMQALFPEGYYFYYLIYGLSWANIANNKDMPDEMQKLGATEAKWALQYLHGEKAKKIFYKDMKVPYGAFYFCWRNYLTAKILEFETVDSVLIAQFKQDCRIIANAYVQSETPYLESYFGSCWPADNLPGIASLAIHDRLKLDTISHQQTINRWWGQVSERLDPGTGMIPHSVAYQDGTMEEGARGSSQSLMLLVLPDIDSTLAEQHFKKFQKHLCSRWLGLPSLREYPKGKRGTGDIDSGPVIFGVGAAASVVGTGTLARFNQMQDHQRMLAIFDAFGFPSTTALEKKYIGGYLPIGDAFLALSKTQLSFNPSSTMIQSGNKSWLLRFALWSLFLLLLIWVPAYFFARSKK